MILRLLKLSLVGVSVTACSIATNEPLTTEELETKVTGNRFLYSGPLNGYFFSGTMQFNDNGNLYVETDSGVPEGGTWRIDSNQLCLRLVALRAGKENCFAIFPTGRGTYKTSHGFEIERVKAE